MTGDSSWFEFSYGNDGTWLLPEEIEPEMDGSKLGVRKIMVIIIWGIKEFYVIDFLPEGESFNTPYYIENILNPLANQKVSIWPSSRTTYSPDIAPSDFYFLVLLSILCKVKNSLH